MERGKKIMKKIFILLLLIYGLNGFAKPIDTLAEMIAQEVVTMDFLFEAEIESINTKYKHTNVDIRQIRAIVDFQNSSVMYMEDNPIRLGRDNLKHYRRVIFELTLVHVCMNQQYKDYLENKDKTITFKFTDKHGQPITYVDVDINACKNFGL